MLHEIEGAAKHTAYLCWPALQGQYALTVCESDGISGRKERIGDPKCCDLPPDRPRSDLIAQLVADAERDGKEHEAVTDESSDF